MKRLADMGLPQFVLPPQPRPDLGFLRRLGFTGSDAEVNAAAWKAAPILAGSAWSASCHVGRQRRHGHALGRQFGDGRLHFTPANLLTNLHRSLEPPHTTASAEAAYSPIPNRFAVHDALPPQPHFADEGAANHVRLCAGHGAPGVNLFVYGRKRLREPGRAASPPARPMRRSKPSPAVTAPTARFHLRQNPTGHRGGRLPQRRGLRRRPGLPVLP